jgi:Uma2 family endonuclease
MGQPHSTFHGPFHAEQIRSGDPYELSNGHAIECMPTGGRGAAASSVGAMVLGSDPDVTEAGIDTGYSPKSDTLRAPDFSVGNVPEEPGWVEGVPPLAVEYADTGQDVKDLKVKISELLAAGTRWIWVIRLTGPRRVEVYEKDQPMRLARPGDELEAPGVLRNTVPVEALYDRQAGRRVSLRNLLQGEGYESLEAVRQEGREQGHEQGHEQGELTTRRATILEILAERRLEADADVRDAITSCDDLKTLKLWSRKAVTVNTAREILARPPGS